MFGWLLEQVLGNLPTWLWPAIAGGSAVVYFLAHILGNFPNFKPYAFLIKPVAFVSMLVSVFMYGGAGVTDILQAQIKEQEAKIAQAVEESNQANDELQKKIDRKNKKIKEIKDASKALIKSNRVEIDRDCSVPDVAIRLHNNSASQNTISKDSRRP